MNDLMENIKNLRLLTGAGFLDCKKALEENNNDVDSSVDYLRKKGLAKANKKLSREANEGAVGIYSNQNITSILKINTETDFAAKNEVFLNFMDIIGQYSLEANNPAMDLKTFSELKFNEITINDMFKEIISKIGENILLNKITFIKKDKTNSFISTYIHNSYKENIGKIAVVLHSQVEQQNEKSKVFGKNLCMHIAASKPMAMNIEDLDDSLINKEKDVLLETIKSSGKPDNIVEKILEGKMKKFYSESTFMNQFYILDPDKTIKQVLEDYSKENGKFEIINYELFVLGI